MSFTPFTYLVVCLIVQFWILNDFVNSIGKKIYFLYFFNFFYCLNILTTPALGYIYYPANDDLSKLWGWYMKVPEVIYMQNTIPSVIILQLFIKLFDNKINNIQQLSNIIYNIKQSASENGKIGIKLLCIGILSNYIPRIFGPLEYVLYLFSSSGIKEGSMPRNLKTLRIIFSMSSDNSSYIKILTLSLPKTSMYRFTCS